MTKTKFWSIVFPKKKIVQICFEENHFVWSKEETVRHVLMEFEMFDHWQHRYIWPHCSSQACSVVASVGGRGRNRKSKMITTLWERRILVPMRLIRHTRRHTFSLQKKLLNEKEKD